MNRPTLAMIGHGTDGSEVGLEAGIHLRWAFRREVGFPPKGFCLYRRPARKPPMVCFDFDHLPGGIHEKPVKVGVGSLELTITSAEPIRTDRQPIRWTEAVEEALRGLGIAPIQRREGLVLGSRKPIHLTVPLTPVALVEVIAAKGTRVVATAYAEGRPVDTQETKGTGNVVHLLLQADRIDAIQVEATDLRVVRVCVASQEPCESMEGWKPVAPCPLCLPVTHGAYKCGERRPDCDEEEAQSRLPKDPCVRSKYAAGGRLTDFLDTVRTVVDSSQGPTMGSRMVDFPVSFEDCPPPGSTPPDVDISALDLLLITSINPAIALMLGLYYVDATTAAAQAYDYKIVGSWPKGTLWALENTVDFDEREPGELLVAFAHENITFAADRWCRVVPVPTNFAGTKNALRLQPDAFDWSPFFAPAAGDARRLFIGFDAPVGEVQVYARQGGAGLTLNAYRGNTKVATAKTTNPEALLAVHAPEIDTLELVGDLQWLYKVHYEVDYIPHGEHCYIVYGLRVGAPAPLASPGKVTGVALPGVTRKQNDCEPLMEGALSDTRHPVGVRWTAPTAPDGTLLSKDPILFHVERENPDSSAVLVTDDQPLMVTPPDSEDLEVPPGWPKDRPHFIDIVPYPGSYRYRVAGIDIFGRQSKFGDWSPPVAVAPLPPPPPASVTAKWLDPRDPFLTESERQWVDSGPGVLLTWEWLLTQERQSPYVQEFELLLEKGWLNLLLGTAVTEPVAGAGSFTVQIEIDRPLAANILAGMMMSHQGVPYRIWSSGATGAAAPFISTLVCGEPNSGAPTNFRGALVAVPLVAAVQATIESIQSDPSGAKDLQLFTADLQVAPPGGLVGGVMAGGGYRWDILSANAPVILPNGVRVTIRVQPGEEAERVAMLFALLGNTVNLDLAAPSPPYVDYRLVDRWPSRLGPIPAEGTGKYEVFVRETAAGEAPGRTTLGPRRHRVLTDVTLLEAVPLAYGQAALAAAALGQVGPASPPATFVRVSRDRPVAPAPPPPADDLAPVYASYPDYHGNASYAYRWARAATMRYVVYRALDETVFGVDRRVGPGRSKVRADWDSFLNQFDDRDGTLRDRAFDIFVVRANPPDYGTLSNRLLQILASFPDVEEACSKLHPEPIAWDDPQYDDRATEVAGPGEAAYVPQPNMRLYVDRTLPGQGTNRYFYRVRVIDAQGNAAPMSMSTPPIYLRLVVPPRAPVLTEAVGGDRRITIAWASNREPVLSEYRVYGGETAAAIADVSRLVPVHVEPVPVGLPGSRPAEVRWTDQPVEGGVTRYYRLVAAAPGGIFSPPSGIMAARAYDYGPPAPPIWLPATRDQTRAVSLQWTSTAPLRSLVQRREGSGPWLAVSGWLESTVTSFVDGTAVAGVGYTYRLRVQSQAGVLSTAHSELMVAP